MESVSYLVEQLLVHKPTLLYRQVFIINGYQLRTLLDHLLSYLLE